MKNFSPFPQPISEQIWHGKYQLITPNPDIPNDDCVEDTWNRIAYACAGSIPEVYGRPSITSITEDDVDFRSQAYYNALHDFKFLPAGRITAGAGSGRNVTLFNCYVMGQIPDSMAGIFDMLKEAALTMQQGGGIGYDFTPLRPRNAPVKGVDADASGPITFMDVWDAMCRTVMSAGSRRGAMMATMRCDHPDIEEFVTAKQDSTRLRMFNVSVLATDAFMKAVKNDELWPLVHTVPPVQPILWDDPIPEGTHVYKVIKARDLWKLMMESTYNYAEPGVLFIDRINDMNNLQYCETITATNPCGEQPLPPYGACLLGSINLVKFVVNPFSQSASIDWGHIEEVVEQAVDMLDSIIDISLFPIPQQKEEAKYKRRMGLGITGLADMLFMMGEVYGSEKAADLAEEVMMFITITAYRHSINLAKLYGPCPATETKEQREAFINSGFMQTMPTQIREGVLQYGIRNALLTSIAPTGTISLYAGNVSSGVEPIFATHYTRKVLEKDGTKREELVQDYAVKLWTEYCENNGIQNLNHPALVTAQTLTPQDHLVMQAAVQKWVDSSISKTINCPEDISFEEFENIYLSAYDMGCKGCTTYRPNAVTGSVLSVDPEPKEDKPVEEEVFQDPTPPYIPTAPMPRKKSLCGNTYKLKWNDSNYYVTINNFMDDNGVFIPFEIFINTQDMSQFQWTVALTRMMSSVFRRGGDISFVIEDLKCIMDPNGGAWVDGRYVPSFIALLGYTLEEHVKSLNANTLVVQDMLQNFDGFQFKPKTETAIVQPEVKPDQCPSCKSFAVMIVSGCPVCVDCGHSKCS